jgi:uncharacterized membrane protein
VKSMMTTTTTKLGVFALGLVLAITGGRTVFSSKGVTIGDFLAGALMLVGVVCMIKSFGLTPYQPSRPSRAVR